MNKKETLKILDSCIDEVKKSNILPISYTIVNLKHIQNDLNDTIKYLENLKKNKPYELHNKVEFKKYLINHIMSKILFYNNKYSITKEDIGYMNCLNDLLDIIMQDNKLDRDNRPPITYKIKLRSNNKNGK